MKRRPALDRWLWAALLGVLIVVPNLFALRQLFATGGYLFYTNAFDESTYLSYDGALLTRSLTHAAEYLVVALHKLGVSGGYTNLLFDVISPVVTVILLRHLATKLGFSTLESVVYPFVVVALPVAFGYSNPYYSRLFDFNYNSSGLSWVTLPQAYYPPFFRTPEPQLSLAVVALATTVAIRWRSYLVALAIVPFIYPFVGIPYMFIVLGLMVHDRLATRVGNGARRTALSALAGYLAIAGTVFTFYVLFVRRTTLADFLPPTHLPLLSGTGLVAIAIYLLVRSRLEHRLRVPALLFALAPTAAANTQLIAGFLQAPHNLEQNFGVIALAVVIVLALHTSGGRAWVAVAAAGVACCLLGVYSVKVFAVNASMLQQLPISKQLLDELETDPESLVFDNPDLADVFALVAPRLHFSALAHSQTLPSPVGVTGVASTAERFQNYLCVKQELSAAGPADAISPATLDALDHGFRYLNQDFPLIHLDRKSQFRTFFDPTEEPRACPPRTLRIFPAFVLGQEFGKVLRPWAVTTPAQQWAYGSVVELTPEVASARVVNRFVDIRATVTVTRGCLSVGVLTPDQRSFLSQTAVMSGDAPQVVDSLVESAARPGWIVLSNCSADGASAGSVQAVRMFPVESVTTRSVAPKVPELDRR